MIVIYQTYPLSHSGTPSLALPKTLGSVIETVAKTTGLPDNVEITMEANPTSTNESKLR